MNKKRAFTLIEIILTILLVSILGTMMISIVGDVPDSEKWNITQAKMAAIKKGILGSQKNSDFGYIGDMGRLPPSLTVLTAPESPLYVFNTYLGVGAGWRGPYVSEYLEGYGIEKDAWGREFIYSTSASPPHLISYGADGKSSGTVFDTDLTIEFSDYKATVEGALYDGKGKLSNQVVSLNYALDGVLTSILSTSDSSGYFSFENVPYGVRAILVTSVNPLLGPIQFEVNSPKVFISPHETNRLGKGEVTYNTGSVVCGTFYEEVSIHNPQSTFSDTDQKSLTLDYTIPSDTGSTNLVLVVIPTAEDSSTDVQSKNCYWGTSSLTNRAGIRTTNSSGDKVGLRIYSRKVQPGQHRTIVVNWRSNMSRQTVHAITLAGVGTATPEATRSARNNSGTSVTSDLTTKNDGAYVITGGVAGNSGAFSVTGTNHTLESSQTTSSHAGAMGSVYVPTKGTISNIGYTSSGTSPMALVMAAFTPGLDAHTVTVTLTSTYTEDKQLDYITVWTSSSTALLYEVILGDSTGDNIGGVTRGVRADITSSDQIIPAGSTNTQLLLYFDTLMTGKDFKVTFEWTTGEIDTISFST